MMELYSEWYLFYRSRDAILSFTDGLMDKSYTVDVTDEYFDSYDNSLRGVMCFLIITKQK
jgi:hypothetical protein